MTIADRWLLPDGVEELLPEQAEQVEYLRRKLLDLYYAWGYELVVPPLLEFTDSLLVGLGKDVDLQTFKVVDQLSGRTMGIRPDMTTQMARIDAHCLKRDEPVRLCYAGSVLHTRPKSLMASRSPIQLGAELYGDGSLSSDIEIISLMLETLQATGIESITLDLGHVGIYRALLADAGLAAEAEETLFDALQRKSATEINTLISQYINDVAMADMLRALSELNGGREVLTAAAEALSGASESVKAALADLEQVADVIQSRMPDVNLYFDLAELRGYHYHTGLVFSALAPGLGRAVANGGRYDDIGEVFGRARPATGFSTDLKALLQLLPAGSSVQQAPAIFAPNSEDIGLWQAIQQLRTDGERVVQALPGQTAVANCDRQLTLKQGQWQVESI
ncbi:MAG: ATP phosphoribosyltransferase regulatory subunit [Pseudohongiellaceae bacterium]|jgi:ATP phosphoribosyltransferase regulatory subunit